MKKLWLTAILTIWMVGCQGSQPVLTRLPDPLYNEVPPYSPPPPPRIESPVRTQPPPPVDESWLPPRGITRRWSCIVIHHTASDIGSLAKIDQWHRDKGWDGCGYDFIIGNGTNSADGKVEVGPRWREQRDGAHTRLSAAYARQKGVSPNHYNEYGIGIVLVGNYDKTRPSARQMESLARLVRFLMRQCKIPESRILTHGGVDQTHCPGKHFSMSQLKSLMARLP